MTFDFAGEERPFPLDVVPRVVAGDEWEHVAPGVAQRVRALEAFLADVYGPQRAIADGVIPRSVVVSSTNFLRAARGITPPNGVRVHVSGIDLIRDSLDGWRVLEDNVRVPSAASATCCPTGARWRRRSPSCSRRCGSGRSPTTRAGCWPR